MGPLVHSPADVVRWLLAGAGLATDPATSSAWPAYADAEPGSPDEVITVRDTTGRDFGFEQPSGDLVEHHGIQVRVRARDHATGWAKARSLAVAFDRTLIRQAVTVGPTTYCVHSVSRTSGPLGIGTETGASKRHLFTLNATVYLVQT